MAVGEIVVCIGEHPRDVGHESLAVFLGRDRRRFPGTVSRIEQPEGVRALDSAPDTPLGDRLQHPRLREQSDMAIDAPGRNVVELGHELTRGQRTITEKRLDDPQAHRVEQEIRA